MASSAIVCPICDSPIHGDLAYAEFHAANCNGEPAAKRPCTSTSRGRTTLEKDEPDACPICLLALVETLGLTTPDDQAVHVDACLLSQQVSSPARPSLPNGNDSQAVCPVCGQGWDADENRDEHVADCLEVQRREGGFDQEEEESERSSLGSSFDSVKGHPGVMPILFQLLQHSCNQGASRSVSLCIPDVVYINGQITDFGWGCGYRNMQMLLSVARTLPSYEHVFQLSESKRLIPSIEELQVLIEGGWKEGFDPEGRDHFNGKLHKRRKWIGTTGAYINVISANDVDVDAEVYVALTLLGIRATIYDFPKASGPKGTHTGLTKWVQAYFAATEDASSGPRDASNLLMAGGGTPVRRTNRPPLYLQHEGHSRTIVGLEQVRNGDLHLLLFDPGRACPAKVRKAAAISPMPKLQTAIAHRSIGAGKPATPLTLDDVPKVLEPFRVSLNTLSRNKQYQILVIEPGPALTKNDKLARKRVRSTTIH